MRKLWKKLANNLTCNKINANWFWAAWSYYVKRLWLEPKYLPSPYCSAFFRTSGVVKLKVPTSQPKLKKRSVHSDIVTSNSTKKKRSKKLFWLLMNFRQLNESAYLKCRVRCKRVWKQLFKSAKTVESELFLETKRVRVRSPF